jgi:triosephosphate isomerase (TIM)
MTHRRKLIAGNWKMHGRLTSGLSLVNDLMQKLKGNRRLGADIVVCPPYTLLWPISEVLADTSIKLGAQDCHPVNHGAYTGDISAAMLVDMGCRYVILGHSERRNGHDEPSSLIAKKVAAAQQAGLIVILCIGETRADYESGKKNEAVAAQLKQSLPEGFTAANLVVAYEPVWAIGSGVTPTMQEVEAMHRHIRATLGTIGEAVQVIYGGSVTPQLAETYLASAQIDGFLVGSVSLNADGFWGVCEKVQH